jgi:hypothetical protein
MPRQPQVDNAGMICHTLNRGNRRQITFHEDADCEAFIRVLAEGLGGSTRSRSSPIHSCRITGTWRCVRQGMATWALFLRWVTATHALRYCNLYAWDLVRPLFDARFSLACVSGW